MTYIINNYKQFNYRRLKKLFIYSLRTFILTLSAYIIILCFPEFAFAYKLSVNNITVYSDRQIPVEINKILNDVELRLAKSEINNPNIQYKVFICNNLNRFKFFTNTNYRVGGINYVYFNQNAFLRPANIERNKLISFDGSEVPGTRTLTYYITHEVTHGITVNKTGKYKYKQLPSWIKEGYADYIGKGKFNFFIALKRFKSNGIEMNVQESGLYLRYHLMVAYLLDIKKISTDELLSGKYKKEQIENELENIKI